VRVKERAQMRGSEKESRERKIEKESEVERDRNR